MKKAGVKDRIIATASDLFYHNGYNQTGINQIIAEANVAKASMYVHFRSKEDIAVAYLQRRHGVWMGNLASYVAEHTDPKSKILGSFDFLEHWLNEVNFRGCGWQNIVTDLPEDHSKIKDQAILHKSLVREWIHGVLSEAYSDEEAANLGDEIHVLLEGAIILSQINKESWPILKAKSACKKLLA
ncbi:TetR/AcrR family transcriptional regulator [Muriicola sp. Z0-33]|uniref:TetR/AcrR family transcriptional regulator n=1 Tax=Muriicola sp. Z0-33 TaxID=2816957 RepID=UPI002236FB6A|nr:TetR/AcrR family transcriptional regulator [Muriicola sp. Z0-33]MCW5515906.1 TetR/AcrR family transcriptional regulator [Muriicola sp. Z0-33]